MSPRAKQLRAVIAHITGAWVRVYRDGTVTCGIDQRRGWTSDLPKLEQALTAAGHSHRRFGSPGTSGYGVIEITSLETVTTEVQS